jgi:hypothetical protein
MIKHFVVAVVATSLVSVGHEAVSAASPAVALGNPSAASFEGKVIDLSLGWGEAKACIELGDHTECFRTEKQMTDAHPDSLDSKSQIASTGEAQTLSAVCSSSLRLYNGTSYGGTVLTLTTRQQILNLSGYGFDNLTSSYKVGACSASFNSAANLGGSVYPGSTSAGSSATSMLAGWDNVVSSVYIY